MRTSVLFLIGLLLLLPFSNFIEARTSRFEKVFIVIFENTNYQDAAARPFFLKLASEGATLKNFHAETHPSQPNYIALISGSQNGCTGNGSINIDALNITDLLAKKGKSWKVYAEAYPGKCFLGDNSTTYARRHNPFVSFKSIQSNVDKCSRIVDASELAGDIEKGNLSDYSFYIPDVRNDGHDTGVAFADTWYSARFGPLLKDARFMKGMLLVSTFDESGPFEPTNHIYTSLYGAGVKPGASSNTHYTHYDLLRTIEDAWDLGVMSTQDKAAVSIADVWQ